MRRVCPLMCKCNEFKIDLYVLCNTFSDIFLTLINFCFFFALELFKVMANSLRLVSCLIYVLLSTSSEFFP
ncbi:hypothetical protein MUK42_09481 [Musa troglodytarum]|uniref:Uncharacterized protein n=1 Tax=Musa troglodytarum TaxID=320322 RepID=A0A9E7EST3_9LILI|nr:hypothetical protein MUK42_09481 [Musa troglodytarum]